MAGSFPSNNGTNNLHSDVEMMSSNHSQNNVLHNDSVDLSTSFHHSSKQNWKGNENRTHKRKISAEKNLVGKKVREDGNCEKQFFIIVSDAPSQQWIYRFIRECYTEGEFEIITQDNGNMKLIFYEENDCTTVFKELNCKGIQAKMVYVHYPEQKGKVADNKKSSGWRPDVNVWAIDPDGLYGLKPQFLESLYITPPIHRWVHVTNFRCDKSELRDVMELAGHVISCSVMNISRRVAKVQYSHPLEAVQAISMLNGRMFFGLKLRIHMERSVSKNEITLPKGLANIGLGFGKNAKPVRDIVRQYKHYYKYGDSDLNPKLFTVMEDEDRKKTEHDPIDFRKLMSYTRSPTFLDERTFQIKHAEDLDSNGSVHDYNQSPDSNNIGSPVFNDGKELDYSARNKNSSQYEVPGNLPPIEVQALPPPGYLPPAVYPGPIFRPPIILAPAFKPALLPIPYQPMHPCPYQMNLENPIIPEPMQMANPIGDPPYPEHFSGQPYGPPCEVAYPMQPYNSLHNSEDLEPERPPNTVAPSLLPQLLDFQSPVDHSLRSEQSHGIRNPVSAATIRPGPIPSPLESSVMVKFSNLSPSTTLPSLCEKLSHCGRVMSMQFIRPACAVVTFSHPAHAEMCYQTFNGKTIDGYVIIARPV